MRARGRAGVGGGGAGERAEGALTFALGRFSLRGGFAFHTSLAGLVKW